MKQFIFLLAVIFTAFTFAEEKTQGVMANVELQSGLKQRAQFIGVENDTVHLGGYVKNQFTIVRLPKSSFKSIVDEQGNDLLYSKSSVNKTAKGDSSQNNVAAKDSLVQDTLHKDSLTASPDSTTDTTITEKPFHLESNTVFVGFNNLPADSTTPTQVTALVAKILAEAGEQAHIIKRSDFESCNDDICMQNKLFKFGATKIYSGKITSTTDSLIFEIAQIVQEDSLPVIRKASKKVSKEKAFSDIISNNNLKHLIFPSKKMPDISNEKKRSYIFVDSDPEGATVSRAEKHAICKTPCTFTVMDTNKIELYAYWNVESRLWGAQSIVRPIPGDTVKISLKLKKVSPEVRIITQPFDAEVYPGKEEITKHSKPITQTPGKIYINEPGMFSVKLRKIGYRDTLVNFYLPPVQEKLLDIKMERITNFNELEEQQAWQHDRKMLKLGHALMGASIAPLIVGTIFAIMGSNDYNDAKDIKDELKQPGSVKGTKFQEKIKKNNDLVDDGDKKTTIGASMIGAGVILFGIGLFFTF